jgi:chromosome segregation ATPase
MDSTVLYVGGTIATAFGTVAWWAVRSIHARQNEFEKDLAAYKLHVAETYVNQNAFEKAVDVLSGKLDRIESKLDTKADK